MKVVVIEGIDRVGKTTLANIIKEKYGAIVLKDKMKNGMSINEVFNKAKKRFGLFYGKSFLENIIEEKLNTTLNVIDSMKELDDIIVIDRFHISEYVYGTVERSCDSEISFRNIDDRLKSMDALLIYVRPTDVDKSSEEHGKDLMLHDFFMEETFKSSNMNKIACSYDDFESEAFLKVIEDVLDAKKGVA